MFSKVVTCLQTGRISHGALPGIRSGEIAARLLGRAVQSGGVGPSDEVLAREAMKQARLAKPQHAKR